MSAINLKNKITVITGGASGIGFAIAEEFLKNNARITVLLDIADSGNDAANQLNSKYGPEKAIFIKCDVTSDVDTISQKIFDEYKKVDVLVNSAGIVDEKSIQKTMEVNVIALIELSVKFYNHMSKEKEGTIINISSIYGYRIDQFAPFYKASKFAIMGFSRSLGHERNYQKSGVRVIVLCPGFTRTYLKGVKSIKNDEEFIEFSKTIIWQDADMVGKAAVDIYEHAQSGTAWQIEGGMLSEVEFNCKIS